MTSASNDHGSFSPRCLSLDLEVGVRDRRIRAFAALRPDTGGRLVFEAAMAGKHVLGILPTGTGKSLCYQIPALSRYDKTGALTVVISPLVALMAEEVAEYLQEKDVSAEYFHAGLPPEPRKNVQRSFIEGELRVIAATNAFGMGIDKPDVRLVIHADIPGSLENYLQEAGRAGRDREKARCVLLYTQDDVERQFGMSARSRLTRREIHGVLRALRNLDRKKRLGGEVVATSGEILGEDDENAFERDSATDDTRVRTAIAWLEEAVLVSREENQAQVFPSSLRVSSVEEARIRLERKDITEYYRAQLLTIAETLIDADPDEGTSTDALIGISGLNPEGVRGALYDLERLGIASNDTALTAFVHTGVARSSQKRLGEANDLEIALIEHLRNAAPDLGKGDASILHLRVAAQVLRDAGVADPLPERLWRILRSISFDGRGEGGGGGSLRVRKRDAETVQVTIQREWNALEETASRRREGAHRLLEHLLACLPSGSRGTDLLAETTLGKLLGALQDDLILKSRVKHPERLLDRALLWLHEQEVSRDSSTSRHLPRTQRPATRSINTSRKAPRC